MRFKSLACFPFFLGLAGICLVTGMGGCSSSKPEQPVQSQQAPARYSLTGRVVSVDKGKQQVVVDAAEISGFMMAMTMGYAVKNPSLLEGLSADDQITADVVVNGSDVWLENIAVVKKPDQANAPPSKSARPDSKAPAKKSE